MFDNIGGKIKVLAQVICCIGIIASVILALIMFITASDTYGSEADTCTFLGFLFLIGGTLGSWISSFFIYGFGELIEKASEIAQNTKPTKTETSQQNYFVANNNNKVETTSHKWRCESCGKMISEVPCKYCDYQPKNNEEISEESLADLLMRGLITNDEFYSKLNKQK